MPPKKEVPKSRTAGSMMESVERVGASLLSDERIMLHLHGVARFFDAHHQVRNTDASISINLSIDNAIELITQLTQEVNTLKSKQGVQ